MDELKEEYRAIRAELAALKVRHDELQAELEAVMLLAGVARERLWALEPQILAAV